MLSLTPTGTVALNDLTGAIQLDLEQAAPIDPDVETWLTPGMLVLIEGVYEEDFGNRGGGLAGTSGVGGILGGRFIAFSIGAPKAETRVQSLGLADGSEVNVGGGFGWTDFLGVGSERAVGSKMRKLEQRLLTTPLSSHDTAVEQAGMATAAGKLIMLGCVHLDEQPTLKALRKLFTAYSSTAHALLTTPHTTLTPASTLPTGFVLFGPFTSQPALVPAHDNAGINSRAYKEAFDSFAALLHEFPVLLRHCTFTFVPGAYDPWPSAFCAGSAVPLPQHNIPDMFVGRIRREFASANADQAARNKETRSASGVQQREHVPGEAVFTSNPARLSLFGPKCEIVLFRDDATGRLRRNCLQFGNAREENEREEHRDDSGVEMTSSPPQPDGEESSAAANEGQRGEDVMEIDAPADAPVPAQREPPKALDPVTAHARRLTKTLLDQSYLSPYPNNIQPTHWSYAGSLSLYPLPSAFVLCDKDAPPFTCVYQGCATVNVGSCVGPVGERGKSGVRWNEFCLRSRRGLVRSELL